MKCMRRTHPIYSVKTWVLSKKPAQNKVLTILPVNFWKYPPANALPSSPSPNHSLLLPHRLLSTSSVTVTRPVGLAFPPSKLNSWLGR